MVTAGRSSLDEIDNQTMASKIIKGCTSAVGAGHRCSTGGYNSGGFFYRLVPEKICKMNRTGRKYRWFVDNYNIKPNMRIQVYVVILK